MVDANLDLLLADLKKGHLAKKNRAFVRKMTQNYPCFHTAHLMEAIYLKNENDSSFEEELPHLAARVLDRVVLYDLVHKSYSKEDLEKEQAIVEARSKNVEDDREIDAILQKASALNESVDPKVEIYNEGENLKSLANAINDKAKTKSKKKTTKRSVKKSDKSSKMDSPKTFVEWLKNKKSVKEETSPKKGLDNKEELTDLEIDLTHSNEAQLILEAKKSSYKLEDFLVNQIEIKQHRKESIDLEFTHAVSETYAKILEDQGSFKEAIKVYKELSIKYPEKSSNFARQIEKLKTSL